MSERDILHDSIDQAESNVNKARDLVREAWSTHLKTLLAEADGASDSDDLSGDILVALETLVEKIAEDLDPLTTSATREGYATGKKLRKV